jgi:hypothetical protein
MVADNAEEHDVAIRAAAAAEEQYPTSKISWWAKALMGLVVVLTVGNSGVNIYNTAVLQHNQKCQQRILQTLSTISVNQGDTPTHKFIDSVKNVKTPDDFKRLVAIYDAAFTKTQKARAEALMNNCYQH